jgi:hypothetical protein
MITEYTAKMAVQDAKESTYEYMLDGIEKISYELGIKFDIQETIIKKHSDLLRTYMECCTKEFSTAIEAGIVHNTIQLVEKENRYE